MQLLCYYYFIVTDELYTVLYEGNEGYQSVQTSLAPGDLVQSAVVVSSTPGGTVFLEPQAVTLTELPGGTVQTLPAGSTFEGGSPGFCSKMYRVLKPEKMDYIMTGSIKLL